MPAKGIAKNCLILIFATAVALAMAMPSVSPATNGSDGHPHWKSGYRAERAGRGNWTKYEAAVWERHFIDQHGGMSALENIKSPITEAKYNQFKHLHNPC